MCAPKNQLIKTALIGAAIYATGGAAASSLLTTSGGSLAAASTTAATTASTTSTLSTLANVARYALPAITTAGNIYQGYMQSAMLTQKAGFIDFEIATTKEASALRKAKRNRALAIAIGKQNARFGLTGTTLEGSPGDVLSMTASNFAEDQYIDDFNTSQTILSKSNQSAILRQEAKYAKVGGYLNAVSYLGTRGFEDLISTKIDKKTLITARPTNDQGINVGDAP